MEQSDFIFVCSTPVFSLLPFMFCCCSRDLRNGYCQLADFSTWRKHVSKKHTSVYSSSKIHIFLNDGVLFFLIGQLRSRCHKWKIAHGVLIFPFFRHITVPANDTDDCSTWYVTVFGTLHTSFLVRSWVNFLKCKAVRRRVTAFLNKSELSCQLPRNLGERALAKC
jgi:hypothetical protein